jgi:SAM-dependent methyltransferase
MAITAEDRRSPASDAVAHYESLLDQHGAVASGVGWNSESAQQQRFEQLCEILPREDIGLSVLDFGCGFGALAEFLAARRKQFTYVGYDLSRNMVDCARKRANESHVRFESDWNQVPTCDYAIASGVFNVRGNWSDERWRNYLEETLRSIHDRVTSGWSANFLTADSDPLLKRPELYYADPIGLFQWCRANLSRFVALHHDYPLFDFTILVRKAGK